MTEKLTREFAKIQSSLNKSKKLILADIEKIDEKYRKLAQEEKKNLNDSLSVLNEQLKYYKKMLGDEAEIISDDVAEEDVDTPKEEFAEQELEEDVIEDTIFPDNNPVEDKKETEPVKEGMTTEDIVSGLEAAGVVALDKVIKEETETEAKSDIEEFVEEKELPDPDKNDESVIEDIPEVKDTDWSDVKLDENGWPIYNFMLK